MTKKKNPLDPYEQIATALGARRVCAWCAPHFRAKLEGRSGEHTHCDDTSCGCHCQDGRRMN